MTEKLIKSKYIIPNDNYMSKIKNMLISIIDQMNSNNIIKSSLINLQDFNQKELFDELDILQKGYLNSIDIIQFLKKFSLNFSEQLIRRFIQHYDKKTPYKLYFEDFNALITPKTIIKEENENNKKGNRDEIFLKVLKNEFKLIVKYHEMIVDIKKCENFITYEAFISISDEEKNISNEKLKKFLGSEYSEEDTKNLLYYLDMDNDGFLTYDEFEDFFASMPVSQDDINYMNNEEIKYAVKSKEKYEKESENRNELVKDESNNQIVKTKKEENISVKNNVVVQNKIIYEENISRITEVKKKEIKYDAKNINIKKINNENINIENINDDIHNEDDHNNLNKENDYNFEKNNQELISKNNNNNKIVKKINYNNINLLKNNKEIIEYEEYLKNRYSSTDENLENNIMYKKNNNYEQINNNNNDENFENNLNQQNVDENFIEKNITKNKIIIHKNEVNRQENNINNKKQFKIDIKSNIINKEFQSYNSPNNEINEDNIKENNMNENNQFSSSYKVIDNSNINNREIVENINIKNNKNINNNNNNNNDYNNLFSSNNFSGNISSTDFNKSDNFISENNINNNIQKNNEIEYKIINENEYNIENDNININNNKKLKKELNNKLNIERENLEYIQNKKENDLSDEIKEEDLYIQKNTNIEIKKEDNLKEQEKNKISSRNENKRESNNLQRINNKNENMNKIETNNNSLNHNSNSDNSHANNINVNGSLFTCGGNIDQEKITLKPGVQEIENEEYKYKINSIQTNNDLVTQIKSEYKMESPFTNINKNLNDVFSKEVFIKNNNQKNSEFLNNNKYFYFQDRIQREEDEKINYIPKNKNENIYINKMNKEKKKNNIIKNLNMNKAFKEQIHEEREDYIGELSEIKYKYSNEKYIIENNNLKNNLKLINNTENNMNLFSNEIITQKSESSENDDFTPNNEQTIHDLSHIIDINSNEYNFSSKTSINIFLDYIDNILKLESTCLILKESLALREDITFKELFCLFDYHKNKNISVHEFKKVCKNILGLYPTTDQVTLIFKRYDMNKDEKLDLKEFLNMISPIKKEYLSILFGDKRIQKPFRSELSDKSKKIIENLTKAIILNETNYYEIKEKMRMNNFNKKEVWNILMQFSKNKNYLNKKNFDRFLKAHSYYLTSYEIDIIFNKFDFDKDNHLSMNDFNHEFHF